MRERPRHAAIAIASLVAALLVGVAGFAIGERTSGTAVGRAARSSVAVPRPDFAAALPRNYRATRVLYARLSGGPVPDAVVASLGPPGKYLGLHPADLQVLVWDPIARRWNVAFDAQKGGAESIGVPSDSNSPIEPDAPVTLGTGPVLDGTGTAAEEITQMSVARFSRRNTDLVFATYSNSGAGSGGSNLSVVNLAQGVATVDYGWSGQGGVQFRVVGRPPHQTVEASAGYWTAIDADCCPARDYRFRIAKGRYYEITDVADDRPFLGVYLAAVYDSKGRATARVVHVVRHSPAAGRIHLGDVLLGVAGAKKTSLSPGPTIVDEVAQLKAGQDATIEAVRGGRRLKIPLTLGSIIDQAAVAALLPASLTDYSKTIAI